MSAETIQGSRQSRVRSESPDPAERLLTLALDSGLRLPMLGEPPTIRFWRETNEDGFARCGGRHPSYRLFYQSTVIQLHVPGMACERGLTKKCLSAAPAGKASIKASGLGIVRSNGGG